MLQYEVYSLFPSDNTVKRNWQHCIKPDSEVHYVLRNKIYCFGFVKQTKNKVYIFIWVFKLLVVSFH